MTSTTAGHGRIIVELHGEDAVFAELSSTYPLKLLSPRVRRRGFATVYMISYGGGLVSGDEVVLSGQVRRGTSLVLLSQGSTKVFKLRPGHRAATAAASSGLPTTQQTLEFTVETGSALFLLPDPVTCFEAASYNQIQRFRLEAGASLAVLDWVTSGRKSRGEEWLFSRYFSVNEIEVGGKCVAKDVLLLEGDYRERVQAYSCYATLFLVGPAMGEVVGKLREEYGRITVFRTSKPEKFLWSLSELGSDGVVAKRRELEEAMSRTKAVFKTYKPVSPGIRHLRRPLNSHLWQGRPIIQLTVAKRKSGGRNSTGRITVRHRGGGHRQRIRILDYKRDEPGVHDVVRIEYDPNRSAHIALLKNRNPTAVGTKKWSYIIAPEGIRAGDEIQSFRQGIPEGFVPGLDIAKLNNPDTVTTELVEGDAEGVDGLEQSSSQSLALGLLRTLTLKPGNVLPLRLIPIGTVIHNIALIPTGPGVLVRSAGSAAQVVNHEETRYSHVQLQSGEVRKILRDCCATIGRVSNPLWKNRNLGKAGRARWLGRRPSVRGVAMNANDHPHGGGRGKSKSNKHPVSIWGWGARGTRTRKPGPKGPKNSNKMVIRERPRGKATRSN
ncbi:Ribosomal-L2-C domain-containing protein [Mycena indigotica]|uniref:Large ribosomal subunit protein uL2m n=1 Tax=Mycena indigotica TaxID=2126181 RepID=A0A8H6SYU3_9AGAR|nr:Ribosomal-L2-C domain-containing protein [Mycena indigotica]KAF7306807.1 Ribosomal-L2-C domain-containing protein [Mycena indigotica]